MDEFEETRHGHEKAGPMSRQSRIRGAPLPRRNAHALRRPIQLWARGQARVRTVGGPEEIHTGTGDVDSDIKYCKVCAMLRGGY